MIEKHSHSYATQVLYEKGIKLYVNGERILRPVWFSKPCPRITTTIRTGELFIEEPDPEKIQQIDYQDLTRFGLYIARGKADPENSAPRQKVQYYFTKKEELSVTSIPREHQLLFGYGKNKDKLIRCVNLRGPKTTMSGETGWEPIDKEELTGKKESAKSYLHNLTGAKIIQKNYLKIPEIVIGITEFNEICCLNHLTFNPFKVAIVGSSGYGKTLILHRCMDQIVNKLGNLAVNIHDPGNETDVWSNRLKTKIFTNVLKKFNEPCVPLPLVYLHLNSSRFDDNKDFLLSDEVGFKFSLNLHRILEKADELAVNPSWNFGEKSGKYFRDFIISEEARECESIKELVELVKEKKQTKSKEGIPPSSANLIIHILKDLDNMGITSNDFASDWEIEFPDGRREKHTPWICCLLAGLPIVFPTESIVGEDWMPIYAKEVIKELFDAQERNLFDNRLYIFSGETADFFENKELANILDVVFRRGRMKSMGLFIDTQHYSQIPNSIVTNLTHKFIFHQNEPNNIRKLNLKSSRLASETTSLKERECIVCGEVVLYDSNGNRRVEDTEVKVKLLPPNSEHKPPTLPKNEEARKKDTKT